MRAVALLFVLSWLSGLALGAWQTPWWLVWGTAIFCFGIAFVYATTPARAVACTMLVLLAALYAAPQDSPTPACAPNGAVEGVVVAPPQLSARSARYTVALREPLCTVIVTADRFPAYSLGDSLAMRAGTQEPVEDIARESPGYARFLEDGGIALVWRYPEIVRIRESQSWRARLQKIAAQHIATTFVEPDASVVHALVLADDSGIPQDLEDNFKFTGLTHLLAISGMNISLWAGFLVLVASSLRLSLLLRGALISSMLWGYMYFLDWPVSAVRATLFWTLALLALHLRLLVSLPTILVLTVLFLTSLQPTFFRDVGFQLSVMAVVGIFLALFLMRRQFAQRTAASNVAIGSVVVTAGATLATWPIIAYHFHTVAVMSVVANALVAPVVGIQMLSAALALGVGLVHPALALAPAFITHSSVRWMGAVAEKMALVPGAMIDEVALPLWAVVLWYAAFGAAAHWLLQRQGRSWREIWQ